MRERERERERERVLVRVVRLRKGSSLCSNDCRWTCVCVCVHSV